MKGGRWEVGREGRRGGGKEEKRKGKPQLEENLLLFLSHVQAR
jgi:hypothetical protein